MQHWRTNDNIVAIVHAMQWQAWEFMFGWAEFSHPPLLSLWWLYRILKLCNTILPSTAVLEQLWWSSFISVVWLWDVFLTAEDANTVERRLSERQSSEMSNIWIHIFSFYVQTTKNQRLLHTVKYCVISIKYCILYVLYCIVMVTLS